MTNHPHRIILMRGRGFVSQKHALMPSPFPALTPAGRARRMLARVRVTPEPMRARPATDAHAGGIYRWAFWGNPRGIVRRGIEFFDWGEFYHVELVTPDNEQIGATWPRVRDGVYLDVRDETIRFFVYKPGEGVGEREWARIEAGMRRRVGADYDWRGIFGHVTRREWQDEQAWMCHELAMTASAEAGYPLQERRPYHRLGPNDMMMSPRLMPI